MALNTVPTNDLPDLLKTCDFLFGWQKAKLLETAEIRHRLNGSGQPNGNGQHNGGVPVCILLDAVSTALDQAYHQTLGAGLDALAPLERREMEWAVRDGLVSSCIRWGYEDAAKEFTDVEV